MSSFRFRFALLAGAIAALLLVATGIYAWRLTTHFNFDRLDRELRNLGAANLDRVVGDEHWRRVETALRSVSGADRSPGYAISVINYGRPVYQSPQWPSGIDLEAVKPAETYEGGRALAATPQPPRSGEPISPRNPALPRREPRFFTTRADGGTWRVAVMGNPYTIFVLAANIDEFDAGLAGLRRAFLAALPAALVLVGAGAWLLAGWALRPLHALTQAAERVTARGLDQRIEAPNNVREFQRLVQVFNEMLDRLEKSFHQAKRFSADASHELKTPLALLQAELEEALATAPAGSPHQQTCTSLLEEVHRLKAIVQKILLLSLADSGRLEIHREPTDLAALLTNVIEDSAALAPTLTIETNLAAGVMVESDAVLLEQALQNLAGNAIKYNRGGGKIQFTLRVVSCVAFVEVGNTGSGIAAEDRPRMFERFFRGDRSRRRGSAAGVGLGLSLSREILRAHGGDLKLEASRDDWTQFVASLPCIA